MISLIIISGCVTRYKLKAPDGHTQQQQARDQIACQEKATTISSSGTRLDTDLFYDCLKSKGYIYVNQYSDVPVVGGILSIEL